MQFVRTVWWRPPTVAAVPDCLDPKHLFWVLELPSGCLLILMLHNSSALCGQQALLLDWEFVCSLKQTLVLVLALSLHWPKKSWINIKACDCWIFKCSERPFIDS